MTLTVLETYNSPSPQLKWIFLQGCNPFELRESKMLWRDGKTNGKSMNLVLNPKFQIFFRMRRVENYIKWLGVSSPFKQTPQSNGRISYKPYVCFQNNRFYDNTLKRCFELVSLILPQILFSHVFRYNFGVTRMFLKFFKMNILKLQRF